MTHYSSHLGNVSGNNGECSCEVCIYITGVHMIRVRLISYTLAETWVHFYVYIFYLFRGEFGVWGSRDNYYHLEPLDKKNPSVSATV